MNADRMRFRLRDLSFLVGSVFLLGLVAACGGGSSSDGSPTPARSVGEITALGSIFVNGVKFETEGAELEFEGIENPNDDNLKVGMIVAVEGGINDDGATGTAERIRFEDNVRGPLTGLTGDDNVKVGTIMGQTVIFEDNLTKFDPATGLPLGDDVGKIYAVSGFMLDDNRLQATFAAEIADGGILEVQGVVSELDLTSNSFKINALNVDFANAVQRDLPAGLANGLLVEARGTEFDPVTTTLIATEIEGKNQGLGGDIAKAETEGFVTGLAGNTFFVNGQEVLTNDNTAFRAGLREDLIDGVKVEAEGPLSGGVIQATRVTFKESLQFEANAEVVNGNTLTLEGLNGIIVLIDENLTRNAAALANVISGDGVKIRARPGAGGLVATRLEAIDPVNRLLLQGPVDSFSQAEDRVTILGIDINTSTIQPEDFQDVNDAIMGRAGFFSALQTGSLIKARFDLNQNGGEWDQIEFED